MTLFRALRHRSFALLWTGQTVSRLGDSLYRIALAWWVLEETGSAAAMGGMLIFSITPQVLFLLFGGMAADRLPRVGVMLASDVLRGALVALVALLALSGQLQVWHVYVASIVFGLVSAFFNPAYTALVPEITPREVLPSANSLTSLSRQVTSIAGPALGAILVKLGGTPTAFALNALSFIVSAAFLWLLPAWRQASAGPARPRGSLLGDLREGLAIVMQSPWLWITIAVFSVVNITIGGPFAVALPFLVTDHLNADVGTLGLLQSMFSIGLVAGAVGLGHVVRLQRRGLLAYGATLLVGLTTLAMSWPIAVPGASAAVILNGLGISAFSLVWTNTLQEMVPRAALGRVASIDELGSFILLPVGYGLAGWATDQIGAAPVFAIGGVVTMGLAALALLHPAIRKLD